ncbi:MAG: amidohydrolase [Betaproteobacteria bacterium]|nr:amidohydrolase [Betaproteobacteria bacterium]
MYEGITESYKERILSADGHVVEPPDLWLTRMDKRWRDKAPKIEAIGDKGDYVFIDGMRPRPLAFEGPMADLKAAGMEIPSPKGYRYTENVRAGCYDPHERIKDQDLDGVSGEVIFPGIGLRVGDAPDADYLYAACRAYNDWVSEFCGTYPERLRGSAMLPTKGPIENAISEAQRAARMPGIASVMMPCWVPDRPFNLAEWDPLWAALQDLDLVCCLHIGSGKPTFGRANGPGAGGIIHCANKFEVNEALQQIIWGGAPMRFPGMTWGIVEGGSGWVGATLPNMDHWWHDHKGWMLPRLEEPPSFYYRRQLFSTFEDDRAGILTREISGVENMLWGADYPHSEGVWPFSRKHIARDFADIPASDTRKIVHDNAVRIFGFPAQ